MADSKDLNVKISADSTQAKKDHKAYLDSITAEFKAYNAKLKADSQAQEKIAKQTADAKKAIEKQYLASITADWKQYNAKLKADSQAQVQATKQVADQKKAIEKGYLASITADYKEYTRQFKAEQKALIPKKGMSGFQLLEFGENLTVVTAGLVAATSQFRQFAKEVITTGANLIVLKSNFKGTKEDLELFGKATTGNLGEGALIALSNRATALGFTLKDQALLFDLAENAADAYGGSIESNFDRVVDAIAKGGRGLEVLGVSTKLFKDKADELSQSLLGLAYKDLDAAQRQMVGFKTIIALTGGSMETLNNKTADVGDSVANLGRAWDVYKEKLGETIINQVKLNDKTADFSQISGEAGQKSGEFLGMLVSIGKFIQPTADAFNPLLQTYRVLNFLIQESIDLMGIQQKAAKGSVNILSLDERVKSATDKITGATIPDINISSSQKEDIAKGNSGRTQAKEKEVEITNELIDTQKRLNDLLLKESTFIDKNTLAYFNYTQQLRELENQLSGLNLPMSTLTVNGSVQTLPGLTETGITPYGVNPLQADKAKSISETAEDVGTITGAIATSMNALGVGTDNFVGKMLAGFDSALGIIQAIKTVNTVLSFIPGFASGGNFVGGGPIMVGERGAELIFPNTSGYVMNNYNSMKYLNSNSQPIYVGVNLNSMDIYTTGRKEFNNLSSQKRVN